MDAAVIAARLAQFAGVSLLFGGALFRLYAAGAATPPKGAFAGALLVALVGALAALALQAAAMAGVSVSVDPPLWGEVLTGTTFGRGLAVRLLALAAAAAALVFLADSRRLWVVLALAGGIACASFAWTGHAAGGEGATGLLHRGADAVHMLAAALWLGALLPLAILVLRPPTQAQTAHAALARFSGLGGWVVAALVLTGVVNSAFLVGTAHALRLAETPYGRLLLVKLALFALMLVLAAANRFVLTPRLAVAAGIEAGPALARVRASLVCETLLGLFVLAAVSALGVQVPAAEG